VFIGWPELTLIILILLLLFGPSKLPALAKSVGETVRELRKTSSEASEEAKKSEEQGEQLIVDAAKKLGIVKREAAENTLKQLKDFWSKNKVAGKSFINFETALLRIGKDFCRKRKCVICPVKSECLIPEVP